MTERKLSTRSRVQSLFARFRVLVWRCAIFATSTKLGTVIHSWTFLMPKMYLLSKEKIAFVFLQKITHPWCLSINLLVDVRVAHWYNKRFSPTQKGVRLVLLPGAFQCKNQPWPFPQLQEKYYCFINIKAKLTWVLVSLYNRLSSSSFIFLLFVVTSSMSFTRSASSSCKTWRLS